MHQDSPTAVPADSTRMFFESGWLRPAYWNWLLGGIFFIASLAGTALAIHAQPAQYTSEVLISFEPRGDRPLSGSTIHLLMPRYVAYATSGFVANATEQKTGVPVGEVSRAVSAGITPETANMTISAVTNDPVVAHAIAEAIATEVLDESTVDELLRARVVSPAEVPWAPSGRGRLQLLIAAILVSTVAGCAVAYLAGARSAAHRARTWRTIQGAPNAQVPASVLAGRDS